MLHLRMGAVATDIDYVSIAHHCYEHSSNGQYYHHHFLSMLCSLVATDVADISFHSSLLRSMHH
jgi:hypothetical protein